MKGPMTFTWILSGASNAEILIAYLFACVCVSSRYILFKPRLILDSFDSYIRCKSNVATRVSCYVEIKRHFYASNKCQISFRFIHTRCDMHHDDSTIYSRKYSMTLISAWDSRLHLLLYTMQRCCTLDNIRDIQAFVSSEILKELLSCRLAWQ